MTEKVMQPRMSQIKLTEIIRSKNVVSYMSDCRKILTLAVYTLLPRSGVIDKLQVHE